jgi:hypothetical protein
VYLYTFPLFVTEDLQHVRRTWPTLFEVDFCNFQFPQSILVPPIFHAILHADEIVKLVIIPRLNKRHDAYKHIVNHLKSQETLWENGKVVLSAQASNKFWEKLSICSFFLLQKHL